jgi:Fe2+ transport system protein B
VIAGLLSWSGILFLIVQALKPVMACFNLPPEAAGAILLGSIRKDGIAVGLLDAEWASLKIPLETPVQVLTAVYMAGVLLPCVVTLLTVAREMRWPFALGISGRQAFALHSFQPSLDGVATCG